jgi:hypothetical protein
LRKAGDNNNGGVVVNILVTNVGGMFVGCGDGDGRGQGVFAAGREGATGRALGLKRVAGAWSAAGTNSRLAGGVDVCVVVVS